MSVTRSVTSCPGGHSLRDGVSLTLRERSRPLVAQAVRHHQVGERERRPARHAEAAGCPPQVDEARPARAGALDGQPPAAACQQDLGGQAAGGERGAGFFDVSCEPHKEVNECAKGSCQRT